MHVQPACVVTTVLACGYNSHRNLNLFYVHFHYNYTELCYIHKQKKIPEVQFGHMQRVIQE